MKKKTWHVEGKMSLHGRLRHQKSVFDLQSGNVMQLDIIEKLDATHQSFTLVFLCFLRRTRGFQSYGDKQDAVIRWDAAGSCFFVFFLIQTLILLFFFLSNSGEPVHQQSTLSLQLIPPSYSTELLRCSFVLAGSRMCSASCAICFSHRQRGGNWSKVLCLSTEYLNSFFLYFCSKLVCICNICCTDLDECMCILCLLYNVFTLSSLDNAWY